MVQSGEVPEILLLSSSFLSARQEVQMSFADENAEVGTGKERQALGDSSLWIKCGGGLR